MLNRIIIIIMSMTTLVFAVISGEVLAGKHNKCEYRAPHHGHSKHTGNQGTDCVIVDAEAGALSIDKKSQKAKITFTLSKQANHHLEVKYLTLVTFNEDTEKCDKEANKISKKKQKFKMHNHKENKGQLVFETYATVSRRANRCTVESYELVIYGIKDGNLGKVTQVAETETPEPEPDPTVKVSASSIVEGDEDDVMLEFAIKLSSKAVRNMVISYRTDEGTALKNSDFIDTTGNVTFNPTASDSLVKTIQVPIVGDFVVEDEEMFTINIVTDTGLASSAQATIIDNDVIPTVSKADQIKNLRQIVLTESMRRLNYPGQESSIPIIGLDLDGDTDEDVAVVYALPWDNQVGELVIYRNVDTTETGWIEEPTGIIGNAGPNTTLVGDFNGDGLDDLFMVNPYYTDNHIALMQVSGGLVPTTVEEQLLGHLGSKGYSTHMGTPAVGDLDMDGDLDVYIIGQSDPQNRYSHGDITYINDGAGNFAVEHRTNRSFRSIQYTWKVSAEIGDFNGDGINEVFIGTNGYEINEGGRPGHYSHIFGNNNMLMGADGEIMDSAVPKVANDECDECDQIFSTTADVKAIDINGDGWVDVVTQSYDSSVLNSVNARIDIYYGNNDGTFDLSQSLKNGVEMDARLAFEDVNGDGYLDIIGLPTNQQQTYFLQMYNDDYPFNKVTSTVYINDGGGYFTEDPTVTIDKVSILSGMFFMTQDPEYIPVEYKQ